ncbi:MAG: hypothetical protein SGILL_007767 [Bacillariaceae sp.]
MTLSLCVNGFVPPSKKKNGHQLTTTSIFAADEDGTKTTLEVCLSPGCIADGAQDTLQKLQALIPERSSMTVQKGVCCSLCGNGPVVLNGNQKIRKVSSNDKILKLLLQSDGNADGVDSSPSSRSQKILESFDLLDEARAAAKARDFAKATDLFQQGLDVGSEQVAEGYSLQQVEYLVQASQDQARAFIQMTGKDPKEKAIDAAQRSVDLIQGASNANEDKDEDAVLMSYTGLESLQDAIEILCKSVPKAPQDLLEREFATLQELLDLEPSKLTTLQQNKRRSLGFRLQKLEKEFK